MERRRLYNVNKKGTVRDIFAIMMWLFVTAIFLITALWVTGSINDKLIPKLQAEEQKMIDAGAPAHNITAGLSKIESNFNVSFNFVFLGVFMALLMGSLILSFFVKFHPVFLVLFIIIAALAVVVSVPISNSYEAIAAELPNQSAILPIQTHIMANLPLYVVGICFLLIIVIYGKTWWGGEENA